MKNLPIVASLVVCFSTLSCTNPQPISNAEQQNELECNNIRNYLIKSATEITDDFNSDVESLEDWEKVKEQRYQEFLQMMGIHQLPIKGNRSDLNVKVTGVIQKDGYRIEKLYYESLPGLYVPANLYIPDNITEPRAAIHYACGHAPEQKAHYQAHPRKFAQLGFVCLVTETLQFGEVRGEHWGSYARGWFNWFSRGYNPAGVELWNSIRAIDLLTQRPEVDPEKIGVTGISGGGSQSWYIAAADTRVKAVAPVCGGATLKDHILNRTVDGHCDCMMPTNTYGQDFADIGALIAPRPLLMAQANQDEMFRIESVRELKSQIEAIYDLYNQPQNISLIETPGGHSYHETSRTKIFSFFLDKLIGKEITPEQVGDIDDNNLSFEELRVYIDGPPENDKTKTIQDSFITLPQPPNITSENELQTLKKDVIDNLMTKTFHAFPEKEVPFDLKLEIESMSNKVSGNSIYSFNSEEGWRLKLDKHWKNKPEDKKPLLIVLRNYDEDRWASESFASPFANDWNVAYFETRGIGEYGWDPALQWHIRRAAAWTGRTIASMQVYDVLRCLKMCRSLPGVDTTRIGIAARDEMGVIALYASLLDGKCETVILKNPPASQDVASDPQGKGPAIEMLNCLQTTDVYQLPALVWPTKVTFVDEYHEKYKWSENVLLKLYKEGFQKLN